VNWDWSILSNSGTGSYFEAFSAAPAQEIQIPQNSPRYRVTGGTAKLIETLKIN
jgi:hypothetical protein